MSHLNLYDMSVPLFLRTFQQLDKILEKAVAHAKSKNQDPNEYVTAKLAEDMKPLSFQVQTCSNTAKGTLERVGGASNISMADNETTIEQLQQRIKKTVELLEKAKKSDFDGKDDKEVRFKPGPSAELIFTGKTYVTDFALPNFYFHAMTTVSVTSIFYP